MSSTWHRTSASSDRSSQPDHASGLLLTRHQHLVDQHRGFTRELSDATTRGSGPTPTPALTVEALTERERTVLSYLADHAQGHRNSIRHLRHVTHQHHQSPPTVQLPNSASTRNQRLAAISSLCAWMQAEGPARMASYQDIVAIPTKKQIPRRGRRDATLLATLYDTAARLAAAHNGAKA